MCADSIKFKKIEKESTSGGEEEDFNSAFATIRQSETEGGEMAGGYLMEKTYNVSRKTVVIAGVVLLVVVMVMFVISALIGHYTAKSANQNGQSGSKDLNFSPWSKWNQCSVTCGIGTKQRTRTCLHDEAYLCDGSPADISICLKKECNDDQWQEWTAWSECKKVKSACKKTRDRSCHNTNLNIGGGRCVGKSSQDAVCNKEDCFGNSWTEWGDWGDCSTHCDAGVKSRKRACQDHRGKNVSITKCPGQSVEQQWCHEVACKDANECESNPCQRGSCMDGYMNYTCVCPMGWRGRNCEILDHCSSSPCVYGNCTSHGQGYNCTCIGSIGERCEIPLDDCLDIRDSGFTTSGVYTVRLKSAPQNVKVYCDMETAGGGWTVFQNRFDGSVNFYRNFSDYEYGFGDLKGEFWLGLFYMYHLSKISSELRIDLQAADTSEGYETFQEFTLSAPPYYRLDIGSSSGTITPTSKGLLYNDGEAFSTFDMERSGNNCAEKDRGGWWFDNCAYANLNGYYGTPGSTVGYNGRQEAAMTYRSFKSYESLKASKMMFRRKA